VASFGQNGGWGRSRAWLRSAQQPETRTKADQGNRSGTVASFGQGSWGGPELKLGSFGQENLDSVAPRGLALIGAEALALIGANGAGAFRGL
jgi:hypothetical protein